MAVKYLPVFLITLLLSLFLTPLVRRMALRYNFVAKPKNDRWNKRVIPICGGIAIFVSFFISFLIFERGNSLFFPLLAGSTAVFITGLIDDIFSIKPYSKLFAQIIIATFMCIFGISFKVLPVDFLNIFVTIFWFVAIMNAFNLLDNMDGLCAGITVISAGIIFVHYGFHAGSSAAMIGLILGAAALGFLRYNFNPAKIFMGDCGSMFIGFVIAAISVMGTWRGTSNILGTLAVPVLVLGVPVFDTILVTLNRRASGRHFYDGGKDHTSHRLVVLGMSERRAVLTLYFISLCCGLIAFAYTKLNVTAVIVLFMAAALLMLFFGIFLSRVRVYAAEPKKHTNGNHISLGGMIYHKQKMFEIMIDLFIISASYVGAYLLRYEGILVPVNAKLIVESLPIIIIIKLSFFYSFGLYKAVWEYAGFHDLFNVIKAVTFSCISSIIALVFLFRIQGYSRTVFVIDWLLLLTAASGARFVMRMFREYFNFDSKSGKRILIMGAGDAGEYLLRGIRYNRKLSYMPVGFIDDNLEKHGRNIHGVPIIGSRHNIPQLVKKYKIDELFLAIPSMNDASHEEIMDICSSNNIVFKKMSDIALW
ncbi:MAG: hypothetical protein COY77_00565 [Candidatus Omnitrophica bacterium CG_4_10_14_0_8_um_filter_43_18]|nr:MAG: hypothetical protein COY77_00565 [Candidatus Omnitrophica bacterium CG_4_10_14_0_8_um_filter_43_18]